MNAEEVIQALYYENFKADYQKAYADSVKG